MKITRTAKPLMVLSLITASALTLVGCASGSSPASSSDAAELLNPVDGFTSPAYDENLAAMVPSELRDKDAIVVGLDPSLAPKEYTDENGNVVGLDVDMVKAIGNVLGLKMQIETSGFDTLIPGAQNGRFDLLNSSMSPTLERQKVLDFVTEDTSGEQLLIKVADQDTIGSLDDVCGLSIGAIRGALQVEDLEDQSKKCTDAGEDAIDIQVFANANDLNLALSSSRISASFLDVPVAAQAANASNGALINVGPIYRAGYEALAMAKGTGFAEAVAAAVNSMISDGSYAAIFAKWGLETSMIDEAVVNPQDQ